MPYIEEEYKDEIDEGRYPHYLRELAYKLTKVIKDYVDGFDKIRADDYLGIIGTIEGVKLEMWRRLFVPYEDKKKEINGDVYE